MNQRDMWKPGLIQDKKPRALIMCHNRYRKSILKIVKCPPAAGHSHYCDGNDRTVNRPGPGGFLVHVLMLDFFPLLYLFAK